MLHFQSRQEVKMYSDIKNLLLFIYDNHVIDCTDFTEFHPGGTEILEDYNCKDITKTMVNPQKHIHSQFALKKLLDFKIGEIIDISDSNSIQVCIMNNSRRLSINECSHFIKENAEIQINENEIIYKQYKLNKNKGAAWQLAQMNLHDYMEFSSVSLPVKKLKIYDNGALEYLNRIPWVILLLFWLGVAGGLVYLTQDFVCSSKFPLSDKMKRESNNFSGVVIALFILCGLLLWSKLDYLIKRFVLHLDEKLPDYTIIKFLHFIAHQSHHFVPDDRDLIFMHPVFVCIICGLFWVFFKLVLDDTFACVLTSGFVMGYVISDFVHFRLHQGRSKIPYIRDLKKKHELHHHEKKKFFGVCFNIWDELYKTSK